MHPGGPGYASMQVELPGTPPVTPPGILELRMVLALDLKRVDLDV